MTASAPNEDCAGALAMAPSCGESASYAAGFRDGFMDCSSAQARVEWAAGFQDGFEMARQQNASCQADTCGPRGILREPEVLRHDQPASRRTYSSPSTPRQMEEDYDQPIEVIEDESRFDLDAEDEFVPFDEDSPGSLVPESADDLSPGEPRFVPQEAVPSQPLPADVSPFADDELPRQDEADQAQPQITPPPTEPDPAEDPSDDVDDLNFDDLFLEESSALPSRNLRSMARTSSDEDVPRRSVIRFKDSSATQSGSRSRSRGTRRSVPIARRPHTPGGERTAVQRASYTTPSQTGPQSRLERGDSQPHAHDGSGQGSWRGMSALFQYPPRVTRPGGRSPYDQQFTVDQNQEIILNDLDDK